jgi:GT2 family glycosyltransferase
LEIISVIPEFGNGSRQKLAVLVTCYNRVATSEQTLVMLDECLRQESRFDTTIFVVDDGSPDGTGARLKELISDVVLEYGEGNLFWNGGMCRAYQAARKHGSFDAYLLFNDDVFIDRDHVLAFFDKYLELNAERPAALAGSTRWHGSDAISYSAFRRASRVSPLSIERVQPDGTLQRCDTFNGNFVLVPGRFFEQVGGLDRRFRHTYGDIDLGYVAGKHGVPTYLAPMPIGRCDGHAPPPESGRNLPRLLRWLLRPWGKRDDLSQRALFIHKHAFPLTAPLLIGGVALSWYSKKLSEYLTRLIQQRKGKR